MVPQSRGLGHQEDPWKRFGEGGARRQQVMERARDMGPLTWDPLLLYRPLIRSPSWATALLPLSLRVEDVALLNSHLLG